MVVFKCHATATEDFLAGKHLGEASVVRQTLEILASEINPVENVLNGSSEYRRNLAVAVVYKVNYFSAKIWIYYGLIEKWNHSLPDNFGITG